MPKVRVPKSKPVEQQQESKPEAEQQPVEQSPAEEAASALDMPSEPVEVDGLEGEPVKRDLCGKLLWSEDDAKPVDRKLVDAAYLRLFGEEIPRSGDRNWVQIADYGDCMLYRTPRAIVQVSCEGSSIYELPAEPNSTGAEIVPSNSESSDVVAKVGTCVEAHSAPTLHTANQSEELSPEERSKQIWRQKLSQAKDEYIEAAIERKKCEGELKSLKETEKEALSEVQRLIERGPERLPLFDSQSSVTPPAEQSGTQQPLPASAAEAGSENGWRLVPITDMDLSSIKGLGDKKLEALIDACPTLGHFVDLQVKAGASGVDTELPKGIGKAITDPLEEMLINFLGEWRKNQGTESSAGLNHSEGDSAAAGSSGGLAGSTATGQDAPQSPSEGSHVPTVQQWEAMTPEQQHDWRQARACLISEAADAEEVAAAADLRLSAAYQSGRLAYNRGDCNAGDCPYIPGEEMDDWLIGCFAAARLDDQREEEVEPPVESESELESEEEGDGEPVGQGEDNEAPALSLVGSIDDL